MSSAIDTNPRYRVWFGFDTCDNRGDGRGRKRLANPRGVERIGPKLREIVCALHGRAPAPTDALWAALTGEVPDDGGA